MDDSTIAEILRQIDERHVADPDGREMTYACKMSHWLLQLEPAPSPELRIAVRAQHLERWHWPRSEFPDGRAGYLAWRGHAAMQQARVVSTIVREQCPGIMGESVADRVGALVTKAHLVDDCDTQTLEDCACLVFLEFELERFRCGRGKDKDLVRILARSLGKMSPGARELALEIGLTDAGRTKVHEALARL